jgi:cystathionine beta-lyase/cystathionine gamma-synthase
VDGSRPETWPSALEPQTRVFLTETIANPLMRVPRLAEIGAFARLRGLVTVIDNTFATPVNFRPLARGFDLVFHSATKYLNGHSDIVAGCVMGRADRINQIRRTLNHFGGSLDPHAGFLLARGIKTLAVRVRTQNVTASALAQVLADHPQVQEVNYPGLRRHPDHEHASDLLSGFGGMISFRMKAGAPAAERLLTGLRIPYVAPSLGGVETLVTIPARTSHAGMKREDRERLGITEDLVRVSCGIEGAADLIEDFKEALQRA